MNRGPVSDDIGIIDVGLGKLLRVARQKGFASVEITPEWTGTLAEEGKITLANKHWLPDQGSRTSLRLDLKPSPEEMLQRFRKVARYEIRRAQRSSLKVAFAHEQNVCDEWLKLYQEMAKAKHFDSESPSHMQAILRWLASEPSYGGLLLASAGAKIVGGIVIVRCGMRCWYVFGATAKNEPVGVGHLLQWHAFEWAKSSGCTEYDFGGYIPGAMRGPAFFKSGFSDNVVSFPPMHRFVLRPFCLRSLRLIEGVKKRLR